VSFTGSLEPLIAQVGRLASVNPSRALPVIGASLLEATDQCFALEQTVYGEPWERLKDSTLKKRRKKGSGAKILTDTAELRRSIHFDIRGDSVVVGTNSRKAPFHGSTDVRTKIPFRPFFPYKSTGGQLELPASVLEDIRDSFEALYSTP
jgi:phage gpG-like protein